MSDSDWVNDHDQWMQQFNAMVNEALAVDEDEPFRDEYDEMAISDIAAKLHNGKIDLAEAVRRTMEWLAGRSGIRLHRDNESFQMEMEVGGLIECTDEFRVNLLTTGEVGLSDAIVKIYADPRLLVSGPGDGADLSDPPAIGVVTKSWCNLAKLHPKEAANINWAIQQALKTKLSE